MTLDFLLVSIGSRRKETHREKIVSGGPGTVKKPGED